MMLAVLFCAFSSAGVLNIAPMADESLANDMYKIQLRLLGTLEWRDLPVYKAKTRSERFGQSVASVAVFGTTRRKVKTALARRKT